MIVSSPNVNVKNARLHDCHFIGFYLTVYLPEAWQSDLLDSSRYGH
jgi:hypothetical protein